MTRASAFISLILITFIAVAACSSEGKIGESCDEAGKTDGECDSGAVCGKDTNASMLCLKVCSTQADCGTDKDCNGVEGSSLKACRLKATASGTDAGKK